MGEYEIRIHLIGLHAMLVCTTCILVIFRLGNELTTYVRERSLSYWFVQFHDEKVL